MCDRGVFGGVGDRIIGAIAIDRRVDVGVIRWGRRARRGRGHGVHLLYTGDEQTGEQGLPLRSALSYPDAGRSMESRVWQGRASPPAPTCLSHRRADTVNWYTRCRGTDRATR